VFYYLKLFLSDKDSVVRILSARPQEVEKYIIKFLLLNNINKSESNRVKFKGCGSSNPFLKYNYVEKETDKYKPEEVIMFDDSRRVIECVQKNFVKKYKDIKLSTCLVEHNNEEEVLRFCYFNGE